MSIPENICRTCGKTSDQEDGSDLYPMYHSVEYCNELNMIQEEFEIWNLNINQDDGLPQKICLTCFDSFCQIHNFRMICQEAQTNFGEFCTGIDIIIKFDPNHADLDLDYPEDYEGEQTITVQEHFSFPGNTQNKNKASTTEEKPPTVEVDKPADAETGTATASAEVDDLIVEDRSGEGEEEELKGIHDFKKYRCEYCMDHVSYDDPDLLNEHYNLLHSSDLPYPCPKCEKCFNNRPKRNSHARVHYTEIIQCKLCRKKVRGGKEMMAQHNELHHIEKPRECDICGKKFEKATLKRFHYHMSWHDDTKLHKCKYCDKKFIQINHLVVHERTHTGDNPFLCNQCGSGFKSAALLSTHMKNHGQKEVECPQCPKKFFFKQGLKLHMQVHDPNRQHVQCDLCHREFRTNLSLRLHKHEKHGEPATPAILNILKKRAIKRSLTKQHKCPKCIATFMLHTQLLTHMKTHDEDRPYKCSICGRSFKRDTHLKLHMNSLHLNNKPHKCSICGWAFSQRNNLREHISSKHQNRRDHKCDECGKQFALAKTLKIHKLKHLDKKPFICTVCNKGFRQVSVLKVHINSHLQRNEVDLDDERILDMIG